MSRTTGWVLLALVLAAAVLAGLALGSASIAPADVWQALRGEGPQTTRTIIWSLRVPRVAAAALVGASLAVSGVIFQALLRNPLAEPYLLGVSSGAAAGAVAALVLGLTWLGHAGVTLFALVGALLAIVVVFAVARGSGHLDTRVLILAGVVVAAFFGACVMLLLTFARGDTLRSAVLWTMGSLGGVRPTMIPVLGATAAAGLAGAFALARDLNALSLGEEPAAQLGTSVERTKLAAYLLASLLAAAAVATAGVIGFIGLVVPHAVRILWGGDHRHLVPMAFVGGALALVLADTVARTVAPPLEIPVGVITALAGVPLFLILLRRRAA